MSCCSTHCKLYGICAKAYESGPSVNWHDYITWVHNKPIEYYCGSDGNYGMFEPADPELLENKSSEYQVALEKLKTLLSQEERHETT